jgi:toxin ParE1/3/4
VSGRGVRLELAPEVFDDFDRFFDHMAQFDVTDGPGRIEQIIQSLQILTLSPMIGRPVKGGKRELVIGHGSRGYVALYRFMADLDTVFVLAVRSQREREFKRRR